MPIVEQRPRGIRSEQEQRRHRERLDVPHHVPVVVVIVRPVGDPEQRRARKRRRVNGAQQVVGARVGDGLPSGVGSVEGDPAFPELVPRRPVLVPQTLESALCGQRPQAAQPVHRAGRATARDRCRDVGHAIRPVGSRTDPVGRGEPAALVPRRGLDRATLVATERRGVGHPERRDLARRVPTEPPVDALVGSLILRLGVRIAPPGTSAGSMPAAIAMSAGRSTLTRDLACRERGDGPRAEHQRFDRGGRPVDPNLPGRHGARRSRSRTAGDGSGPIRAPRMPTRHRAGRRSRSQMGRARNPRRRRPGSGRRTR